MSTQAPSVPVLTSEEAMQRLRALPRPWAGEYLAMYSSWLGGVVKEPWLMSVPLDDHLVHRGDGVFEAMKCVAGRIYQGRRHVERLFRSAQAIGLVPPLDMGALERLVLAVTRSGGSRDCMVRIFVSRGPGGFTTNPAECPQPGLYLMVSRLHAPSPAAYENGVRIGLSRVPGKSSFYASVKSCNYLPNVLLKTEAVKRGWDFAIGLDDEGRIAEGSTENIGIVDQEGVLALPPADNILEGTTALRAKELARELVGKGLLAGVVNRPLEMRDLRQAREAMLLGTTLDVLPATWLEGEPLAGGHVGPVAKALLGLMRADILNNPASSLAVWD